MLVATFEGANRWEIINKSGLHRKSIYTVMDRLQREGYIYTPDTERERGQAMFLSLAGKEVVFDLTKLWGDVVRNGKKRIESQD
jgi:DNA-binding PadR family transcriptional regulator